MASPERSTARRSQDLMSLHEAKILAQKLLLALADEEPEQTCTFGDLFERYMEVHGHRCRSAKRMRQIVNRHLHEFLSRPASSISPAEVLDLHRTIGDGIGFATANRVLEVLRATYNKAIKWGLIYSNPCLAASAFPLESRDRYLSRKDEIDRFLAALETMRSRTFRNFVKTSLFTAARVSNVMEMRWEEIDLDLKLWRISMTKSGKPVYVPLIDEAIAAIRDQEGLHSIWVFPGRGDTGHIVNPARAWERLVKKAGISNLHMHDLRRTMGSWEANTGASLQVIQKTLGHSSIRATHIYARLQLEPVRHAMEVATAAMLAPPNTPPL